MSAEVTQVSQAQPVQTDSNICMFCGIQGLNLLGLYSEEGLQKDILKKIQLYLPIKLSQSEVFSLELCRTCESSILTWHQFVQKAVETTRKLRSIKQEFETSCRNPETNEKGVPEENCNSRQQPPEADKYCQEFEEKTYNVKDALEENEAYANTSIEKVSEFIESGSRQRTAVHLKQINDSKEDIHYYEEESLSEAQCAKPSKIRRKKIEVPDNFFCEVCNKGFTRKFDMQRHKKSKHPEVQQHDNSNRQGRNELLKKCRIIENGKTIYECDICKHRTKQSYNLMRHRTVHTGIKAYVCHICGNSFRLDSSFRKHINQFHEGIKNYKCDICGKEFGMKTARDEHMNIHSDVRPFSCNICQKSFRQKSSLYVHKLYHSKNFKFHCSLCDKKFRRSQELVLHNRLHTGHKPYNCETCGVRFRLSQDLKRHMKTHLRTNEKWECPDCQSTFSHERYLKMHMKIHI